MPESGDGIVEELLAQGDVVYVGRVGVALVVDAKDGRSVKASVRLTRNLDLLANRKTGKGIVDDLHGVAESTEQAAEELMRAGRVSQECLLIPGAIPQTRADVDARGRIRAGLLVGYQAPVYEPLYQAIALRGIIGPPKHDGREEAFRKGPQRIPVVFEDCLQIGSYGLPALDCRHAFSSITSY